MENKRTIEELAEEVKALTPKEKLVLLQKLQHPTDSREQAEVERKFWALFGGWKGNETAEELIAEIYNSSTAANTQPLAVAREQEKKLPERSEPSHQDLDEIFGGFQSSKSAEELVDEIYKLRTIGTQREPLDR